MTAFNSRVLLISTDVIMTEGLLAELAQRRPRRDSAGRPLGHFQVPLANSLEQGRQRIATDHQALDVVVLDDSVLAGDGMGGDFAASICDFARCAPVILVASPERPCDFAPIAKLICAGNAEVVLRTGAYIQLVVALVERHTAAAAAPADDGAAPDFGELLRHEVNNPLTGILGNAELVLARKDQLPEDAVRRVETIAKLAVRLRETVRRLSDAWEALSVPPLVERNPDADATQRSAAVGSSSLR